MSSKPPPYFDLPPIPCYDYCVETSDLARLVQAELEADHWHDDVTTRLTAANSKQPCQANVVAKEPGIFSGTAVITSLKPCLQGDIRTIFSEGARLAAGETVVTLRGTASEILGVERTLLNFLSHACGIATQTRHFVEAVEGFPATILATRKTLPGLRSLQLQAVQAGGGRIHRRSLSDGILIKDNHLSLTSPEQAIQSARNGKSPLHRIEIEIDSLSQLEKALPSKPDVVLLDNFSISDLQEAVRIIGQRCEIEVSGGILLSNVRQIAELGVDYISVGALTHSARALDLSLEIYP